MKLASILPIFALCSSSVAQLDPGQEILFTDTKAIGLLPPLMVSQGMSQQASWSPDGKFLLISAQDMKVTPAMVSNFIAKGQTGIPAMPEQVVTLFNVDKQSTATLWRGRLDTGQFDQVTWLGGGNLALVTMQVPVKNAEGEADQRQIVYSLSPFNGKLVPFYEASTLESISIETDLLAKGAVMVSRTYIPSGTADQTQTRFTWITADGRKGNTISVTGRPGVGQIVWVKPDKPMLLGWQRKPGEKAVQVWHQMNFASGQILPSADPKYKPEIELEADFKLMPGSRHAQGDSKSVTMKAAWLVAKAKGPHRSALVAAQVEESSLSPALNAVFYTTKGLGMVRPLMSLPKEVALKALQAAEKARIMSESKQVGLAFIMLASDYDDVLPSNSSDWMEAVYPYSRDRAMLDGFVYTFAGGNMADIKDPAGTVLGYKPGPGGRAVVYTDGHVKWEPDK